MQNIMQSTDENRPWHKYPLVWMMFAIPFSAVIMGVVMMWLAVDTDDGLVADDYYKLGLEINRVIVRDKKAAELGLSAIVEFDNSARIIRVQFDKGLLESFPESLSLQLQHATRANSDITVLLDHGIGNQYIGHVNQTITEGVWYFKIADADWKINARSHVRANNIIQLQSEY
jgi:hypothetical protein